jgi:uncharacterized protein (DUF488 family)
LAHPYFTIGHSTRTIAEFAGLLQVAGVRCVADVRTVPRSRTNPQFNRDVLPQSLGPYQIAYEHISELGGLRGKQAKTDESVNAFWQNRSFRNYADYALSDDFRIGLARLHQLGTTQRTAIMCAEAVWWRCHRRIIADYLIAGGNEVFHILAENHTEPAQMTPAAHPAPDGTIIYPAERPDLPQRA